MSEFQVLDTNGDGQTVAGSAVALSSDTDSVLLLTNAHVVEGSNDVLLRNQQWGFYTLVKANVLGRCDAVDVAVLEYKMVDIPLGVRTVKFTTLADTTPDILTSPGLLRFDETQAVTRGHGAGLPLPVELKAAMFLQYVNGYGLVYQFTGGVVGGASGSTVVEEGTGEFLGLIFAGGGDDVSFVIPRPAVYHAYQAIMVASQATPPDEVPVLMGPNMFITPALLPISPGTNFTIGPYKFFVDGPLLNDNADVRALAASVRVFGQDNSSVPIAAWSKVLGPTTLILRQHTLVNTYSTVQADVDERHVVVDRLVIGQHSHHTPNSAEPDRKEPYLSVNCVDEEDPLAAAMVGATLQSVNGVDVTSVDELLDALAPFSDDVNTTTTFINNKLSEPVTLTLTLANASCSSIKFMTRSPSSS